MSPTQKLYIVTRRDLAPGVQAVQGMHALVEYSQYAQDVYKLWYNESNYLCFLSVEDGKVLEDLCGYLFKNDINHVIFREPDMDMALTAIAVEPTPSATEALQNLRLALR